MVRTIITSSKSKKTSWAGIFIWMGLTFSAEAALPTGSQVPNFELPTQKGQMLSYQKHFKNKVTLLVLNNYCSIELAGVWAIPFYYRFHHHRDFRFAFVFSNACLPGFIPRTFVSRTLSNAKKSLRLPYILVDWDNKQSIKLGAHAEYTQLYVLDKRGKIAWEKLLSDPFAQPDAAEKVIIRLLNE